MSTLNIYKEIGSLPNPLVADSIYVVRSGQGFDLYVTDTTGSIAHQVNNPDNVKISSGPNNIIRNTEDGLYSEVSKSENLDSFVVALDAAINS